MNKQKLFSHLEYNLWKYIAVILASVILWCSVFNALAKPRDNEKITIEFFGTRISVEELNTALRENKDSLTKQPLKEIGAMSNGDAAEMLYQLLQARMVTGDIIVFSEDLLAEDEEGNSRVNPQNYFKPLPVDTLNAYLHDKSITYYFIGEQAYGLYLDLEQYGVEDIRFVAFFSPESVNLGELNTKGNKTDTAALDTVGFLLGE